MKKVRNIWWHTVLIDQLRTETSNFILNPSLHWKPVECSEQCHVCHEIFRNQLSMIVIWIKKKRNTGNKTSSCLVFPHHPTISLFFRGMCITIEFMIYCLHFQTKPNSSTSDSSHRPRSLSESLHILTSPSLLCGSPSPTRPAKVGPILTSPSLLRLVPY